MGKDFIGREKEIKLLVQYLKMGQSVVIIAPRRFGKTSLVLEVLSRMKSLGYYIAFVDVFANPAPDLLAESVTGEVLKNHKLHKQFIKAKKSAGEMLRNAKLNTVINDFKFIIDFTDKNPDERALLSESIDFIDNFSIKHHKKMVCAFDEFGDIKKFDVKDDLTKLFRSKIQKQTNSTYIFSGSYESVMQNMFVSSKSPFYRMTRIIRLGYLDKEITGKYIEKKLNGLNISLSEDFIRSVVTFTRGHPYYSQLAFQMIVLYHALQNKVPDYNSLTNEMLAIEKDYLEKVWEDVSKNREYLYLLRRVATNGKNIYKRLKSKNINIARATKNLEGKGILFRNESVGYYFSDPLFEFWVKNNIL